MGQRLRPWTGYASYEMYARMEQGERPSLAFLLESLLNEIMLRGRDRHLELSPGERASTNVTFTSPWACSASKYPRVRSDKTFCPTILSPTLEESG